MNSSKDSRNTKIFVFFVCVASIAYLLHYREAFFKKTSPLPQYISDSSVYSEKIEAPKEKPDTRDSAIISNISQVTDQESLVAKKEQPVVLPQNAPTKPQQTEYESINEHVYDTDTTYVPEISPCVSPVGYTIGTIDERFGISKATFEKEVASAVDVWEKEAGKNLFYPSPSGPITVNLIYDERQANTVHLGYLRMEIENTKQSAETVKEVYTKEAELHKIAVEQYEKDTTSYKTRHELYNAKVEEYNKNGGATKLEYDAMMLELSVLKKEAESLEARRLVLLEEVDIINSRVSRYNELVSYANTLIRKNNLLANQKITEGRFVPSTQSIDIYQYSDMIKLRRVLVHEFGHALGILHNDNIQSIMYSFNSGTTVALTQEDKESLKAVCPQ